MLSGFVKKLLFARQFLIIDGKIEMLGKRQIMLPAEIVAEVQHIDEKRFYTIVKSNVQRSMAEYAKKIGVSNVGMLKSMEEIFELYGVGKPEIVKLDQSRKEAVIRFHDPNLKVIYEGPKGPDGLLVEGALAGMFSFLFEKQVECKPSGKGGVFFEYLIK